MEEIMIEEYIRDREGNITKIQNTLNLFKDVKLYLGEDGYQYSDNAIIKHSKNLIDLIEKDDYVNGRKVKHIAMFEGFPDYPKLIFVDETHLIPDDTCKNEDIKTILTKESYMANCYKVGGEDE